MGYTRLVHHACAFTAALGLTACGDDPQQRWSRAEIEQIARDAAAMPYDDTNTDVEIRALKSEAEILRAELEGLRATINGNAEANNANRDTFNDNIMILERRISALEARSDY